MHTQNWEHARSGSPRMPTIISHSARDAAAKITIYQVSVLSLGCIHCARASSSPLRNLWACLTSAPLFQWPLPHQAVPCARRVDQFYRCFETGICLSFIVFSDLYRKVEWRVLCIYTLWKSFVLKPEYRPSRVELIGCVFLFCPVITLRNDITQNIKYLDNVRLISHHEVF